jgi:hypothetical protein
VQWDLVTIDRNVRLKHNVPMRRSGGVTDQRIAALVTAACERITEGPSEIEEGFLDRLQKADAASGLKSLQPLADLSVP